jgi:putative transposase
MVMAVRRGKSIRAVARRFRVSPPTVQRWVAKVQGQRLDRAAFENASKAPKRVANRTSLEIEQTVLSIRQHLKEESPLGEFGALAIRREMQGRKLATLPSLRTINRILDRSGALDYRRRIRRSPPPKGWYLPDVAQQKAELDEFDFVQGLAIRGKADVEVFNVVSLHGGLVGSLPDSPYDTQLAMAAILAHWREVGLPSYAQFDNDNRFSGPHQHKNSIGRVIRLCLSLGVVPVFAPPREHGSQNGIESYNGLWQAKVWCRFEYASLEQVQEQSRKYVEANRQRQAVRIESAPARRKIPRQWQQDDAASVRGRIIYIRRTDDQGRLSVLGNQIEVSGNWKHRLVRCEIDIDQKQMRFFALRRSDPSKQPLLRQTPYELPRRYLKD